jgi:hypothetical protein
MSKVKGQKWLDYLIETIQQEQDPELEKLSGFLIVMMGLVKEKSITKEDLSIVLESAFTSTLKVVKNKHRSAELLKGTKQFILKEFDN